MSAEGGEMSAEGEQLAFFDALQSGTRCRCRRCAGLAVPQDDECRKRRLAWLHPADAWTIRELRKLSIDGSFR
jgi:hypothetical protein